jgi:hypothetical protein
MHKIKRILEEIVLFITDNFYSFFNSSNYSLLRKNIELKDKFEGKKLFIFFTGMSINDCDMSLFKKEYTMGVNLIMLHHKFSSLDVDLYCISSPWSTTNQHMNNWMLFNLYNNTKHDVKIILQASSHHWTKRNYSYRESNTYYTTLDSFIPGEDSPPYCALARIDKGIFSFSIGAAIEMGFKEIYMMGADYTKDPQIIGHFYSPENEVEAYTEDLLNYHKAINIFAQKRGVKIFNVLDDGFSSPVFQGMSKSEVYSLVDEM